MNINIHYVTIAVTCHIGLMYMVIEGNYELSTIEIVKYYSGLACITYAVEFCATVRQTRRYSVEYIYNDNYILLPLFIVPLVLSACYIWGFTIVNLFTVARVISCILSFIVLYSYYRITDKTYLIPILITYIPISTILLHAVVIYGASRLVKYHRAS